MDRRRVDRRKHLNSAAHRNKNPGPTHCLLANELLASINRCRTDKGVYHQLSVLGEITIWGEGNINDITGFQGDIFGHAAEHIFVIDDRDLRVR